MPRPDSALKLRLAAHGAEPQSPTQLEQPAATAPAAAPTKGIELDQPAAQIFTLDRRDLDAVVRVLEAELGVPYIDAVTALDEAYTSASRLLRSTPLTLRDLLRGAGVADPDATAYTVSLTQQRDDAVTRTLDADLAPISAQKVDAQGRVELDASIDVPSLLRDDEARERRWRTARAVSPLYADRARFDEEDRMMLEAGFDLIAGLERPALVARAQQRAGELTRELDAVIEGERNESARRRELDTAISALESRRDDSAPAAVKTLDAPDKAPTFTELTGAKMLEAIEEWDRRGHQVISLDDAAAFVSGHTPAHAASPPAAPKRPAGDRVELAAEIQSYQREHGTTYAQALEAVAGISLGR